MNPAASRLRHLPRTLLVLASIYVALVAVATLSVIEPLASAVSCRDDAIEAAERGRRGELDYSGPCISFGKNEPLTEAEIIGLETSGAEFLDEALSQVLEDGVLTRSILVAGGYPAVTLALLAGLVALGEPLSSGVTALVVSNGTRRADYFRRRVLKAFGVVVAAFLAGVAVATVSVGGFLALNGLVSPAGVGFLSGSIAFAKATAGVGAFFGLGVLLGAVFGRGLALAGVAVAVLLLDALVVWGSAYRPVSLHGALLKKLGPIPFFPTPGPTSPDVDLRVAITLLLAWAAIALTIAWNVFNSRDIPDRPVAM